MQKSLDEILDKYHNIVEKINDPSLPHQEFAKLSKEKSDMDDVVETINKYNNVIKQISDLKEIIAGDDKEMSQMAQEELVELEKALPKIDREVKITLIPRDVSDEKNVILEIRAGTGGDEAALFGAVLLKMYQKYAEKNKWKFSIMSISDIGIGGIKEAIISIEGHNVYSKMKFESGTHRVQRVPETESNGRVHTSAATVAVLPEMDEIDVKINEKDLRVDIMRASGPGGQGVNTTDSAVRITHIPSGIAVQQQDERSQIKNRDKAMRILRAKLYEMEEEKRNSERANDRKSQVGTGDRSEKIRTYNYPQGRVTDHRINLTIYQIDKITNDGYLDEIIEALQAEDEARKLGEVD